MIKRRIAVLIIALISCVHCAAFAEKQPTVAVIDIADFNISSEGVSLLIDINNNESASLVGNVFAVLYDEKNILSAAKRLPVAIGANAADSFNLTIEADFYSAKSSKIKLMLFDDAITPLAGFDLELIDNTL